MAASRGSKLGAVPVLLAPTDRGPPGGGIGVDGRYGFKAGAAVIAPGGRLAGYMISARFVGAVMPTARIIVPIGPLAPFVIGGIGPGWISNPNESGLALLGGGGMMVHFGRIVALGAEVALQTIPGTEFRSLAIGPTIAFGG